MLQKNSFKLLLISIFISLTVIILLTIFFKPYPEVSEINSTIYIKTSFSRLPSAELMKIDNSWTLYTGQRIQTLTGYTYASISVANPSFYPKTVYIINKAINSNVSLFHFDDTIPEIIASFGDRCPTMTTAIAHNKAAFPITIPPMTDKTSFILELSNQLLDNIAPAVISETECQKAFLYEHLFLYGLFIFLFFVILIYSLEAILAKDKFSLNICFLSVVGTFYYLYRTRLLLVITKISYNPVVSTIVALLAICILSFLIYSICNSRYHQKKHFQKRISTADLFLFIAISPWLLSTIAATVVVILRLPVLFITDFYPVFSFAVSLFLISLFRKHFVADNSRSDIEYKQRFLHEKQSLLNELAYPLNVIQSSAEMLQTTIPESRVFSAGFIIEDKINQIKTLLGENSTLKSMSLIEQSTIQKVNTFTGLEESHSDLLCNGTIGIFTLNSHNTQDIQLILSAEGFSCQTILDSDVLFDSINKRIIDLLIIDPSINSNTIFTLIESIRSKYSLLDFPIVGIVDYNATYLIRTGFASGVNDFISKPFDTSELIARLNSQLRLCQFVKKNSSLVKSEHEKGTFLYFITHNINTPLTLLLNELRELSLDKLTPSQVESIDNLQLSANEINDIIQNALVTFRLQDGRCTNRIEQLSLDQILPEIQRNAILKSEVKMQKLIWNIDKNIPEFYFDKQALKGILTNLIDNAIKFSPRKSQVAIEAVFKNLIETDKQTISISISDSGEGIPLEKRRLLFKKFADRGNSIITEGKSIGLGLFVANELALLNNSEIHYSTSKYGGACLTLVIKVLY